jgi:transcriptional regulator with XRE-family HTH domain
MMFIRDAICEKIKDLRLKRGYSQQEVADALFMSQNSYSEFECGKRKLDIERLYEMAVFYEVPIYYFLEMYSRSIAQPEHTDNRDDLFDTDEAL